MNPEDQKQKLLRFFGSGTGTRFGSFVSPITRRISLIPKRSIPQQIVSRLQSSTSSRMDDGITTTQRDVSSLGKVTLNLEQTKNNLERILQVISEDYKNTQEQNKKEADEYRKRIANRGRIFGKKELGDRKTDLLGGIKKYVGSFFSGAGGAIRGLASFNLLEAILNKDPKKAISALLGIGMTYLPAIGGLIGLSVAKSLGKRLLGIGGARAAGGATGAAGLARGAGSLGKLGRFGGKAALVAGGIGLASSLFNKDGGDQTQQRLEELTQQQKASVEPGNITSVPQDDLKKFEALNNKFEKALDFLLGKQKEPQKTSGGGGGGGGSPPPGITGLTIQDSQQGLSELGISQEQFNAYKQGVADIEGARYNQMGGAGKRFAGRYQMGSGEIASAAAVMGLPNPSQQEYLSDPALQEKIYMGRTILMNRKMMQLSSEYTKMSQLERLSVLAGAQLGEGNLTDYLKGKSVADSKGVEIQRWINSAKARLAQVGSGAFTVPPAPVLTSPSATRTIPAPSSRGPIILPMAVPQQTAPQQSSAAVGNNDTVPSIDTTYPENFLALYSKLIYQIV
jgi:hypothetical protein